MEEVKLCLSCDKRPLKYATGLCEECHQVALRADENWWKGLRPVLPPGWHRVPALDETVDAYVSDKGLRVLFSGMIEADGKHWLHVSVSRKKRLPDWEDLKWVKDLFIGEDQVAVQVFPRKDQYVNYHPFCLHLWRCVDGDPVPDFVSIRPRIDGQPMV